MGVAGLRLVLGVACTVVSAWVGAGCGADRPSNEFERGRGVYEVNCAQCHGQDLAGTDRGPSLFAAISGPAQMTDDEFAYIVRNGVDNERWNSGPMPGNGAISDEQIEAIVAYVRA